jgi:hypothetical protein
MTPEEKTLLLCLRALVSGQPVLVDQPPDWAGVYDLAAAHNLQPVLSAFLPAGSLPDDVAGRLSHDSRRRRMRAAVMIEDFQTIHYHLAAAGIRVMPIKGIYLAHAIYPSVSLRYFDDLDLLIPADAGSAALEVLRSLDFVIHPRAPQPDWHHLPPHVHRQHNTMVELHTDLLRRARPGWDIDQIWQRAQRGTLAGEETWLMSDEDALIYTALHARHNLYNRLSFMVDGALLARRLGLDRQPPDRDTLQRLAELADEAGARCALVHLLETAKRLLELYLAPAGDCSLPRHWLAARTAGWQTLSPGRSSLRQGPLPKFIELLMMDSVGDSLKLVRRLVAPSPEFVAATYSQEDGRGPAIGYGRRLWRRVWLAGGQILKAVRNR